jgi:hypothetical protein
MHTVLALLLGMKLNFGVMHELATYAVGILLLQAWRLDFPQQPLQCQLEWSACC